MLLKEGNMRTLAATSVLVVLISSSVFAQGPSPAARHTFVPVHKQRVSVDFGTAKALKRLPRAPVNCRPITKHRHELVAQDARMVELPIYGAHRLTVAPATPCSVR